MARRSASALLGALLLGVGPAGAVSPAVAAGCVRHFDGTTTGAGIRTSGDGSCSSGGRASTSSGTDRRPGTGPRLEVVRQPSCQANNPNRERADVECSSSTANCPPGSREMTTWTRPAGSTDDFDDRGASCSAAPAAPAAVVVLPEVDIHDVEDLGLPRADVVLEPGTGEAVVGLPLNVWARPVPFVRTVELLGFPVTVRAVPRTWTWSFGDGSTLGPTRDPGAPYPAMTTTHTYSRNGTFAVRCTTTWTAAFRVQGFDWQPVAGTVAVPTDAGELTVRAGTNLLTR